MKLPSRGHIILLFAAVLMLSCCVGDVITITHEAFKDDDDEPDEPVVVIVDPALKWSASEFRAVLGRTNDFPALSNSHGVSVTYSSSDTSVATVDGEGSVSLVAAGTAVITAAFDGDESFRSSGDSYTLTVVRAEGVLSWSMQEVTVKIGEETGYPLLDNPDSLAVNYASSDTTVAIVTAADEGCNITLVGAGTTTITAASEQTDIFEAASAFYTLTVLRTEGRLAWSASEASAVMGRENSFPTLDNPDGLEVSFSSGNTGVATVAATSDGCMVTLVGAGITTITATSAQTGIYEAASVSYTLTVTRSASPVSWSGTSCTVKIGSADNVYPTLDNPGGQVISYSSSDGNVATAAATASGYEVTLVGEGVATIVATAEANDIYEAGSAHYTLTVLAEDIVLEDPGLSWSAPRYTSYITGSFSFPTLSNPHAVAVSYSSSNMKVATVSSDGKVTVLAAGTTVITASSQVTDSYAAGSASYTLTILLAEPNLSWSEADCSVTLGSGGDQFPELYNYYDVPVSYSSSNTEVATIDEEGNVTVLGKGTTEITATSQETSIYAAGSASYTLTVSLASPGLSWSANSCTATLKSDSNVFPVLSNKHGLRISYSSSNTAVATVDDNGTVTPVGKGTAVITASSQETSYYRAASVSYTLNVVKNTVSISWSSSSCAVDIQDESSLVFPTLSLDPADITVSYSSSNTGVATIDGSGNVTAVTAGVTNISASFAGNEWYEPNSASYFLTVRNGTDEGDVVTVFESSGAPGSDDDISRTTFTRLVTVDYSSSSATVEGYSAVADQFDVSVEGGYVTVEYSGSENVVYKLTGSTSDGGFRLYSQKKQAIWLSNASITSRRGAAIDNQSGKRTFIYVEGFNDLSDISSASYSTGDDCKGVLFSEGQLIFSGGGTLAISAENRIGKSGIVSDDYVRFLSGPDITVTAGSSAGHGVKANDYVQISGGRLEISTSAAMKKGITSDGYVDVEGGAAVIHVSGGVAYDSEDREYSGTAGIKADNFFRMTGGSVSIVNTGEGGKGIHAGTYGYWQDHGSIDDSIISGGELSVTTSGNESNDVSAKGIKIGWVTKTGNGHMAQVSGAAGNMVISGGSIYVVSVNSEGIEVKGTLTFNGGQTYVESYGDDAINSQGEMDINSGFIYAYSTANDALDTNCDMKIYGGYVYGISTRGNPEVALDANTEGGYRLYIYDGATVVAYGGLERGYSSSQEVYTFNATAGAWNGLYNGSRLISAFYAPSGISSFAVTAPSLSKGYKGVSVSGSGVRCGGTWAVSGISGGTATDLSAYTGGSGGGGWGPRP